MAYEKIAPDIMHGLAILAGLLQARSAYIKKTKNFPSTASIPIQWKKDLLAWYEFTVPGPMIEYRLREFAGLTLVFNEEENASLGVY